jgi:hypothetical protein
MLENLETVWPRHKWDYLGVSGAYVPEHPPLIPSTLESESSRSHRLQTPQETPTPPRRTYPRTTRKGRILAAQALMAGAGLAPARAGTLAGLGARSARRVRALPRETAAVVEGRARDLVRASVERGSSEEERRAALAWLNGESPDHHRRDVEPGTARTVPVNASRSVERQQLRTIRLRLLLLQHVLEPHATSDAMAAVLLVVSDLAGDVTALDGLMFGRTWAGEAPIADR